jgi:hypothetical protein
LDAERSATQTTRFGFFPNFPESFLFVIIIRDKILSEHVVISLARL